mmetsp:Transcript_17641/g.24888  ORF Transcript_17641/g.24888 Transcript_17641/m.24888 type:complete len:164 (-) Transcript_17641:205-696(-)|eukprot:CAMPEP_0184871314 /NCGR_PEP_ID=MMETSP0580-20130426/40647_1 /TAXON_ID=1118495 /ORGANISM="Dactyliosolen fragilissimus" /LENGTH=163 /DNA_ID=CAMNT_0027373957 /DNA_START=415 /DNA_END=906 /DNA_ORIENTATION=-
MELTDEQRERIRKNKERALEIRKKREDQKRKERSEVEENPLNVDEKSYDNKKRKSYDDIESSKEEELEDFEKGASEYITKQQAMKIYCIPEGTLQVCSFIEKENPRQKKFAPMKLYRRDEIRDRAHKRFGGLKGLVEERRRREMKRLEKDLDRSDNFFKRKKI